MRLFLLMLIVTTAEVMLISKVSDSIGFFPTFMLIIFTAVLGSRLLAKQWRFVMGKLQTLQANPSQALLEALLLLISGVLLVTPGFLTDILGFMCLIPRIREPLVAFIRQHSGQIAKGHFQFYSASSQRGAQADFSQQTNQNYRGGDIIDGEYERKDS